MRDANVASTLRIVQVCCSNFGLRADVVADGGDIVSHDAISRRGNNHSARQRRMDIFSIILWRQPSLSVLEPPPQHARQSPRVLHRLREDETALLTAR